MTDDKRVTAMPEVTIIVVSYNTRDLTLECLRSVGEQTELEHEIVVVDNASSDGSQAAIAAAFPSVRLVAEERNLGFARANNLAAAGASGDYLLLLNPDTVVIDGAIDELVAFARSRRDSKIWGGRTYFADGSLNPANAWREMSLWTVMCRALGLDRLLPGSPVFNAEGYGGWDRSSERDVDIVSGCFFLIERDFWNELGGFDSTYLMYGEEADLCHRARLVGARPRVTPRAEIVHYGGASEAVRARKHVKLLQAKVTLIERHFPLWQRPIALVLTDLWPLSRLVTSGLLARLLRGHWIETHAEWRGVWTARHEWRLGYGSQDEVRE